MLSGLLELAEASAIISRAAGILRPPGVGPSRSLSSPSFLRMRRRGYVSLPMRLIRYGGHTIEDLSVEAEQACASSPLSEYPLDV